MIICTTKQLTVLLLYYTNMTYDYWYWHEKRMEILKRDKCCVYCQKELTKLDSTIDHLIPKCKGGDDEMTNLALACRQCNEKKGDYLPLDFVFKKEELK